MNSNTKSPQEVKRKRIIALIIAAVALVGITIFLCFLLLSVVGVTKDGITYCISPAGNGKWEYYVKEIDTSKTSPNIKIADKINSLPVTNIGTAVFQKDGAFHSGPRETNTVVESIYIPKSIKSIDDNFRDCINLVSIEVEEGNPVFHSVNNCIIETESKTLITSCKTSVIPSDGSVTNIYRYAFQGCSNITSLSIPFVGATMNGTTNSYFGYIFGADQSDSYHLIPNNLKEVIITGGTSISDSAFNGCSGLTSITIPDSVTSIGQQAFYNCSGLTSVTIGNGVTSIGSEAFYNCRGLTSITIPDSVTRIGQQAFYNCSGLTSITIPDSVTSIGYGAFYNCSGLTRIVFLGTKAQLQLIIARSGFLLTNNTNANFQIICNDGMLNSDGTEV